MSNNDMELRISLSIRSLAYLQVYPFGPRFLLFTVRNTAVHIFEAGA